MRVLPPRLRRAAHIGITASAGWKFGTSVYQRARNAVAYRIEIAEGDMLFAAVQEQILAELSPRQQRSIEVVTERAGMVSPAVGVPDKRSISIRYAGSRIQSFRVGGHRVVVSVEKEDSDPESSGRYGRRKVSLTCYGVVARDACIEWLVELSDKLQVGGFRPGYHIPSQYHGFHRAGDLPMRPASSVVLADGQFDRILGDLRSFLSDEARYGALGIPWHRGYLLSGKPGTGKTSTVIALANALDMSLFYVPLTRLGSDLEINSLFADVTPRSILLLEDVDVLSASRDRSSFAQVTETGASKLSLSGLLNAIDGVGTPHGQVLFLTTNDEEALDPALTRSGRVDCHEVIGLARDSQVRRLVAEFVSPAHADALPVLRGEIPPSDVIGAVRRHLRDADAAAEEISRLIEAENAKDP